MTRIRIVVAIVAVALAVQALAQVPARAGNWEITAQMEMPGMPVQMPPIKTTQCITKEDAENASKGRASQTVPNGQNQGCKITDYQAVGNKVTWKLACEGNTGMSGSGEMVYSGDSYEGWAKMKMPDGEMTTKYKGKRLGDCVK